MRTITRPHQTPTAPADVIQELLDRDIITCHELERQHKHAALDHTLQSEQHARDGDTIKATQEKHNANDREHVAQIYNDAAQTLAKMLQLCNNTPGGDPDGQ